MNRITKIERNTIRARARELIQAGKQNVEIESLLMKEFNISHERARMAYGHVAAVMRGEQVRNPGRPVIYEEMVLISIRLPRDQADWLIVNGGASEVIRDLISRAMISR